MKYQVYTPPQILKKYVRYFWTMDSSVVSKEEMLITSFADHYPRLIFQNLDGFKPLRTYNRVILPTTYLSGIDTRPSQYFIGSSFSHLGISFYPHALKRFFNVDAYELINQLPDLINFCPKSLNDKLYEAKSHCERINLLCNFLITKLNQFNNEDLQINDFISTQLKLENFSISGLQNKYQLSERQIQRKFKTTIGITPMTYLRIIRFGKALKLLNNTNYKNLSDIAYNLGYSDQSHFIRDFKEFSGYTPKAFANVEKIMEESSSILIPNKQS